MLILSLCKALKFLCFFCALRYAGNIPKRRKSFKTGCPFRIPRQTIRERNQKNSEFFTAISVLTGGGQT